MALRLNRRAGGWTAAATAAVGIAVATGAQAQTSPTIPRIERERAGGGDADAPRRPGIAPPDAVRRASETGPETASETAPEAPRAVPADPAPIGRARDTVVVCSVLLQARAATVLDGAEVVPGTARVSSLDGGLQVVWSGLRIEGISGQKRASCRAENAQIVSLVLDGEELLAGPQPY